MTDGIERDVLTLRIADELRDLSEQISVIEVTLADQSAKQGPSIGAREALQQLDRVRQTQQSLAICLDTIASAAPSNAVVADTALQAGSILPSVIERLRTGERLTNERAVNSEPDIW